MGTKIVVGYVCRLVQFGITYQSFGGCMKYRIIITALIISIGALICSSFSFAQPQDHQMLPRGGPMPREEFVKDLKKELNLTREQEADIQKIFDAQRETMEKLRKETDAKISAVLTEEQKKKFEELQKNRSQKPPRMPRPENEQDRPMREGCPDHIE
jgi:Spy/CpxP family protein refolding chaperone